MDSTLYVWVGGAVEGDGDAVKLALKGVDELNTSGRMVKYYSNKRPLEYKTSLFIFLSLSLPLFLSPSLSLSLSLSLPLSFSLSPACGGCA